uniref:Transposase n=1 Tax=Ditylenchus dipsaci TaxID=166011 RepID=A0A915D2I4_9BILA
MYSYLITRKTNVMAHVPENSFRNNMHRSTYTCLRHAEKILNCLLIYSIAQAPDVVWNGPFTAKLRELYNNWIMNEDRMEWTAKGNRLPASMKVLLEWIFLAWESLPKEIIAKSSHPLLERRRASARRSAYARAWLDVERYKKEELNAEQDEENGYLSDNS